MVYRLVDPAKNPPGGCILRLLDFPIGYLRLDHLQVRVISPFNALEHGSRNVASQCSQGSRLIRIAYK